MPGIEKAEHAKVRFDDFDTALHFYRDVLGMVEIAREDGTVYLGCGLDTNFDLAIEPGETGLDHLAIRVSTTEELDRLESRLEDNGVATERTDGEEPGQREGVQFSVPTGARLEFVLVDDYGYRFPMNPALPERGAITPLDINHFQLIANDVEALATFLVDVAGFRISEVIPNPDDPDEWDVAWIRYGSQHHDLAIVRTEKTGYLIHHLAFTVANYEHMKLISDKISHHGATLEIGPSRHTGGSNLYTYFCAPAGLRWELVAELVAVDEGMETVLSPREQTPFDWWGEYDLPDSWDELFGQR